MNIARTINTIKTFFKRIKLLTIFFSLLLIVLLYIANPRIDRDVLFWFFSSISQSMAALFAVVGMFSIFRYESLNECIKRQLEIIRFHLITEWASGIAIRIGFKGIVEEGALENIQSELESDEGEDLKNANRQLHNNLYVSVLVSKQNIIIRDSVKEFAGIPMISMLFTFVISLFSLLVVNRFFGNSNSFSVLGQAIIFVIIFFIVISLVSIMKFFLISFRH